MEIYFEHLVEWKVMVCKTCKYAVWPAEIVRHLQRPAHQVPHQEAVAIQETAQQRMDRIRYPTEWKKVEYLDAMVPELELFQGGFKCTAEHCSSVCTAEATMKKHFSTKHKGRRSKRGKRPKRDPATSNEWTTGVYRQRFFRSRTGSNFFEVTLESEQLPAREERIQQTLVLLNSQREKVFEEQRKRGENNEPGTETSGWLETVGWVEYLKHVDREEMLASIATPDEEQEPLVWTIGQAMEKMIEHCQWTMEHKAGYYARMEAVRVEAKQTKHRPLQPYMDRRSIKQHALAWKKMVAFFVRRRGESTPQYQLAREEKLGFREMIRVAKKRIDRESKRMGSLSQMRTGNGGPFPIHHTNFVREGKYARAGNRQKGAHF